MLHYKSVNRELLELLAFLMRQQEFDNFTLVGGTSLALQIGHRISIDIDLFGKSKGQSEAIAHEASLKIKEICTF